MENKTAPVWGEITYFLLDAGAITNLYHRYGKSFLDKERLKDGSLYVITSQVKEELENQYNKGKYATLSDQQCEELSLAPRTRLVPYSLMNLLWTKEGEKNLWVEEVKVPDEKRKEIKQKMAEGSRETGNQRIGKGDISLLVLAEQLGPEAVAIVSPDSDIPNTLGAMGLKGVYHLSDKDYAQQGGLEKAA